MTSNEAREDDQVTIIRFQIIASERVKWLTLSAKVDGEENWRSTNKRAGFVL